MSAVLRLFPDQEEFKQKVRNQMRTSKAICAVAQTGFGKTVLAASFMKDAAEKGNTSFFIVPRRELLKQTSKSLWKYGINHGIISSGYPFNPLATIQICTPGTLVNRIGKINPPIVCYHDEGHMSGAQMDKILDWVRDANGWRVALTATPQRLDGKGLDRHYDSMVTGPSLNELIDMGRLADFRYFEPYTPDISGVKVVNGEYSKKQLDEALACDNVRIGSAVDHYKQHAMGKRHVTFNTSVQDAEKTAQAFRDGGVSCMAVYGELGEEEITRRTKALAKGELQAITSVNLLGVGWDIASASGMDVTIESVSLMRPTQSVSLYLQQVGRALRMKPDKALIFDHSGLSKIHGYPTDEREWNLEGKVKHKRDTGERAVPVRVCPSCYRASSPSPACPYCGHRYEIKGRTVEEIEGELVEVSRDEARKIAKDERMNQGRADTFEALLELEERKGNRIGWAENVFMARNKGANRQQLRMRRAKWKEARKSGAAAPAMT